MLEVRFKDGRATVVDADYIMCPSGQVMLLKRMGDHENKVVRSYPAAEVKNVVDVVVMPVKVLAMKLLTATSKTEPHGSRKLAALAGIEYSDLIVPVLKKLREAGKVAFADGKWVRA